MTPAIKPFELRGLPLLHLAAFFSAFDRFVVAPMLVTIALALFTGLSLRRYATVG